MEPENQTIVEPKCVISHADLAMLQRARAGVAEARARERWAMDELEARYGLTSKDRINLTTGEVFPPSKDGGA